jgi:hypothetical protein
MLTPETIFHYYVFDIKLVSGKSERSHYNGAMSTLELKEQSPLLPIEQAEP